MNVCFRPKADTNNRLRPTAQPTSIESMIELLIMTLMVVIAPVVLHFGALWGGPLRPNLSHQKTQIERLLFHNIWLIFAVNGLLLGCAAFLFQTGHAAAPIFLVAALPTVLAQVLCLALAAYWTTHDVGRAAKRVRRR